MSEVAVHSPSAPEPAEVRDQETVEKLRFEAAEHVRAALAAIGRTEDLRFSPGNGLLALAGFGRHRCLILRVRIEAGPGGLSVVADDFLELSSQAVRAVHGIDFVDEQTLVAADRSGIVSIVRLPAGELGGRDVEVEPVAEIRGSMLARVKTPGSIVAVPESGGRVSLLVCNNYTNRVSRHVVEPGGGYRVVANRPLLRRSLRIPDGIAVSPDGAWVAVSSHWTHDVKLFATRRGLRPWNAPAGTLRGTSFAHGLRFTGDGAHILVADAGAPLVHVYERGGSWAGDRLPARSLRVIDEAVFLRGRANEAEGGPKGLDIDRSGRVVAVTCEEQPLAFYPLRAFTG